VRTAPFSCPKENNPILRDHFFSAQDMDGYVFPHRKFFLNPEIHFPRFLLSIFIFQICAEKETKKPASSETGLLWNRLKITLRQEPP
jgi:hypothetical protein